MCLFAGTLQYFLSFESFAIGSGVALIDLAHDLVTAESSLRNFFGTSQAPQEQWQTRYARWDPQIKRRYTSWMAAGSIWIRQISYPSLHSIPVWQSSSVFLHPSLPQTIPCLPWVPPHSTTESKGCLKKKNFGISRIRLLAQMFFWSCLILRYIKRKSLAYFLSYHSQHPEVQPQLPRYIS